jgi:hypothetical protein
VLEKLIEQGRIQSFSEHHTSERVHFKVTLPRTTISGGSGSSGGSGGKKVSSMPTQKQLQLDGSIGLMNMHAFDPTGVIRAVLVWWCVCQHVAGV